MNYRYPAALKLGARLAPNWLEEAVLSEREIQICCGVWQGKTNADIATELFIAEATVKAHIRVILGKLEVGNRVGIALWYERNCSTG